MSTFRTTSVTVALFALVASACGSTTSSPGQAAGSTSPVVDSFDIVATDSGATLIASVNDPDGDLSRASVDWGDGVVEQITAGLPGVRIDHTYAAPGVYVVSLQAVDAAGNATSAAGSADVSAIASTSTDPSTGPSTTLPASTTTTTTPPTTAPPTTTPPATDPPRTDPPRTDPPKTTTTTTIAPIPDPVTIDVRNQLAWEVYATEDDGAGGSAEARLNGSNGASFRSYAWHGYNGRGEAGASAYGEFDLSSVLAGFPEGSLARVDVAWRISANGALKAPWDRRASANISLAAYDDYDVTHEEEIIDEDIGLDTEQNTAKSASSNQGGTFVLFASAAAPKVYVSLSADCDSYGGGKAFALLNESWCDFYEGGGVTLENLALTVTAMPGYEFADGAAVHAD